MTTGRREVDRVNGPSGDWPDELDDVVPGGGTATAPKDGARRPEAESAGDTGSAGDTVAVDVVTSSGRTASVEFVVRPDVVEIWYRLRRCAAMDRGLLRGWLAAPQAPLVVDEVALSLDRMVDSRGRVAISLPDVMVWTLPPEVLTRLRACV
jgi:hypothetical protein